MKDILEAANAVADELEKRSQPGDRWLALASRRVADGVTRYRQTLAEVGVCPNCLETSIHHVYEPFSSCSCGTGEDYGNRPLQKIQLVD